MWIAEARTAHSSDYAWPVLSVVWILLPRSLGEFAEYRCQKSRRQLEDFFAASKCVSYRRDPLSESSDGTIEPWAKCRFSESLNLPDVHILLPGHREGDRFRFVSHCRINFSTEAAAHPSGRWWSLHHRSTKLGGFETMDDCLFTWTSGNDSSGMFDIRCARDRQTREAVLLHDVDCPVPLQLAMDFLSSCGGGAEHAALVLCVSCAASNGRRSPAYYPQLIRDVVLQLARLQRSDRPSSVNVVVRDVHLLADFPQFRQLLMQLLADGDSPSVSSFVFVGGDRALRVPSANADGLGWPSATGAADEDGRDVSERVASISRLICGESDVDGDGPRRLAVDPRWKRLADDCSLFVATFRGGAWFGRLAAESNDRQELAPVASQAEALAATAAVRGFSVLFDALQRHYCWQRVLRPLRGRLLPHSPAHRNGVGALLIGSSGSGKTLLVRAVADRLRLRLVQPRPEQIVSGLVGATEKNVRGAFAEAKRLQPCVLAFEHFDSLLFDSEGGGVLASFLAGLDDLREFNALARLSAAGESVVAGVFVLLLRRSRGEIDDAPRRALHRPDRLSILVDLDDVADASSASAASLVEDKRRRRAELLRAACPVAALSGEAPVAASN